MSSLHSWFCSLVGPGSTRYWPRDDWDGKQIPNLKGKVAVITGANSSLGFHIALRLAINRVKVIITCRSQSKADETISELKYLSGNDDIEALILELDDLCKVTF